MIDNEDEIDGCLENLFDESQCLLSNTSHLQINKFKQTDELTVKRVYLLGRIISKIFEDHGLAYWVTAGTLLGCVRHKGLIPWDDDLDICLMDKDEEKLLSLKCVLLKHDIELTETYFGYRMYHKIESEPCFNYSYPFCDVFLTRENRRRKRIEFLNSNLQCLWSNEWYNKDDLQPFSKMLYGDFYFNAPKNPMPFLLQTYGDDCLEVGITHNYDHKTRTGMRSEKVNLPEGFVPATPFR